MEGHRGVSDYEPILRHEFTEADGGSFMLKLRLELEWDRDSFSKLIAAMERCARDHEGRPQIDRWVAEGFWYLGWFVRDWSSHPHFPRPHGEAYYSAAYERLHDLAWWLFFGESPYLKRAPLKPL